MIDAEIKVDYINHCGDDLSTVNSARVSFEKESDWARYRCDACQNHVQTPCNVKCPTSPEGAQEYKTLKPEDVKLINYLAKHKHRSPFNHSFISVRVKAPVFVARQLVKHKFMPWNEVSRRYVNSEPEFYFPEAWRASAENVKQGSSATETVPNSEIDVGFMVEYGDFYKEEDERGIAQLCLNMYNQKIKDGCSAEQARMVLPQNVMTEWLWSGTLGAFADMLVLRLSPYTQAETRIVAEQIRDIVQPLFPVSLKALLENA